MTSIVSSGELRDRAASRVATFDAMSSALDLCGSFDGGACSATAIELAAAVRFSICDDMAASVRSAMTENPARLAPVRSSNRVMAASAAATSAAKEPESGMDERSAIRGVTVVSLSPLTWARRQRRIKASSRGIHSRDSVEHAGHGSSFAKASSEESLRDQALAPWLMSQVSGRCSSPAGGAARRAMMGR